MLVVEYVPRAIFIVAFRAEKTGAISNYVKGAGRYEPTAEARLQGHREACMIVVEGRGESDKTRPVIEDRASVHGGRYSLLSRRGGGFSQGTVVGSLKALWWMLSRHGGCVEGW